MSSFMQTIKERAKLEKKKIILPEGTDYRVLEATSILLEQGIADIILLGDKNKINKIAEGLNITGAQIIDPNKSDKFDIYAEAFYEIRKHKGITIEEAKDLIKNPLYWGAMMVKNDEADGMVAGAINATSDVLRAALQVVRTAPNTKLVSAFFIMVLPEHGFGEKGTFIFADSGLNENPDAEALSEIALSSSKSFKKLVGAEPKVAMLSYSTCGSAASESVNKMQLATKLTKKKAPELIIDGELQLDAAIVPEVAESKAPDSEIKGDANILIFPDLNAGNIGYKLVQRLAKAEAYGPITQGIAKPINDLSRGCSAEDIVGVVAISCVQAQAQKI